MSDSSDNKLAVLIDADNASKADLKAILEEVAKYGTPTVKRAYGDWSSTLLSGWKTALLENGAVPVQQYAYTTGKNATDAAMIIDAMDFLHGGRMDGFVLISSDSDFTPLALRIRESGLKVYGIGEKKTPEAIYQGLRQVHLCGNPAPGRPARERGHGGEGNDQCSASAGADSQAAIRADN